MTREASYPGCLPTGLGAPASGVARSTAADGTWPLPEELVSSLRRRPSVEQLLAHPAVALCEPSVQPPPETSAPRFPRPPRPPRPPGLSMPLQARWKELLDHHDALPGLDHFALLGVSYESGIQHVQRAFADQIRRFHPDNLPGQLEPLRPYAMRIVAQLNDARQVLSNRAHREAYLRRIGRADRIQARVEQTSQPVGRVALRKRTLGVAAIEAREERLQRKRPAQVSSSAAARLLRALKG